MTHRQTKHSLALEAILLMHTCTHTHTPCAHSHTHNSHSHAHTYLPTFTHYFTPHVLTLMHSCTTFWHVGTHTDTYNLAPMHMDTHADTHSDTCTLIHIYTISHPHCRMHTHTHTRTHTSCTDQILSPSGLSRLGWILAFCPPSSVGGPLPP